VTTDSAPAKKNLLLTRAAARAMLALGTVMALFAVGYTIFAIVSRSQSDSLEATLPAGEVENDFVAPTAVTSNDELVNVFASLYPGSLINPRYWADPNWAGSRPFKGPELPEGYEPTLLPGFGIPAGASTEALRMRIPDIGLDDVVEELNLVTLEDDIRYEQPINIIGHIRGTANPGEYGAGWYFGHQSNFGSSEGAVFQDLPKIFDLFRKDPIYVYVDTETGSFAYRVVGTGVENRATLQIKPSDLATITLVTSWPPLVFDQRFMVFAELVGMKR